MISELGRDKYLENKKIYVLKPCVMTVIYVYDNYSVFRHCSFFIHLNFLIDTVSSRFQKGHGTKYAHTFIGQYVMDVNADNGVYIGLIRLGCG